MTRKEKRADAEEHRTAEVAILLQGSAHEAIKRIEDECRGKPQNKTFWLSIKARLICNPIFNMKWEDEYREAEEARRAEEYARHMAKVDKDRNCSKETP